MINDKKLARFVTLKRSPRDLTGAGRKEEKACDVVPIEVSSIYSFKVLK